MWISSGCGSAVVRRSSRSLLGFGVSLPVAWSHPTLVRCKAFYPAEFFFSKLFPLPKPTVVKIGPPFAEPIRCLSCGNQSYRCHGRFVFITHPPTLFNLLQFSPSTYSSLFLSFTYICLSYSPTPKKKSTYSPFDGTVILCLCSSSC